MEWFCSAWAFFWLRGCLICAAHEDNPVRSEARVQILIEHRECFFRCERSPQALTRPFFMLRCQASKFLIRRFACLRVSCIALAT